jgi:replication factor A1
MPSLEEIIEEISKKAKMPEEDVKNLIEDKQLELSGLVSAEGAAYIVGRELGVNLLKEAKRQLKIKNVVSGMKSVDVTGKIIRIFEPREFERNGEKSSVVNVVLGDETGTVRFSLWGSECEIVKNLKEGQVIRIRSGYTKEDNLGNPEMRLGKTGKIEVLTDFEIKLPKSDDVKQKFDMIKSKKISSFREGEYEETRASIVQIFKKNPFFETCPLCEGRIEKSGDSWVCKEHGKVEPKYHVVLSGVMDDGSGSIRVVFFREIAEKIFGKNASELRNISMEKADVLSMYEDFDILGKEFIIRGRVKKSEFTGNLELVANEANEVNVKGENEKLLDMAEDLKV